MLIISLFIHKEGIKNVKNIIWSKLKSIDHIFVVTYNNDMARSHISCSNIKVQEYQNYIRR